MQTQTQVSMIKPDAIIVTGKNHRIKFDKAALDEMAESIKEVGILNPLTVRPSPGSKGSYELAAGERRLKAAVLAGITQIPCNVMELDDKEFFNVMLIENIQREELNPLEEAQAYKDLLDGNDLQNVALQTGKPIKHIKQRLSLNNLCPVAKKEYLSGALLLGHAQILALFSKKQQEKAMDNLGRRHEKGRYFNNPIELKEYINRTILLSLDNASFDVNDTQLLPEAGACASCPKQTNADKDLFNGLSEESQCMDKDCFIKKSAIFQRIQNQVLLKRFDQDFENLPKLNPYYGREEGFIGKDYYTILTDKNTCSSATLAIKTDSDSNIDIVVMACIDKRCEKHRNGNQTTKVSEIPENETLIEGTIRKSKKRRAKENTKDVHSARKDLLNEVSAVVSDNPNPFELFYIVKTLLWKSNDNFLSSIAFKMGFLDKEDSSLGWHNRSDFSKFIEKKGAAAATTFLRMLIGHENLNDHDKFIGSKPNNEDVLLIHAKTHKKKIDKHLKKHQDLRIKPRKEEDEKIKDMVATEKVRQAKIRKLFDEAKIMYPELHKLKNASLETIKKEQVADLSKMAFRLGLKRKKDGDITFYSNLIFTGIAELKTNTKPAKKEKNSK